MYLPFIVIYIEVEAEGQLRPPDVYHMKPSPRDHRGQVGSKSKVAVVPCENLIPTHEGADNALNLGLELCRLDHCVGGPTVQDRVLQ